MKKTTALFIAILMMVSLVACGEKNVDSTSDEQETNQQQSSTTTPVREYDETDPAAVLGEIINDFADVTTNLTQKLEETFTAVGTTFEDYQKNKELVDEWIALVLSESDALFARTKENSIAYFKLIAADEDHKYSEFCDDALDEYYDAVYDEAMDEYYDILYDEAMDDLYDEYYDGIIDDAYDDLEYEEWSKASSECYKQWSDTSSAIYKKWSDESSYIYGLWSAMDSAFCWNDNYDVDAIVAEYDKEKTEKDNHNDTTTPSTDSSTQTSKPNTTEKEPEKDNADKGGLDPDFKAAMDSYENFMDEYVAFMKKYKANPGDLSILTDYADYMSKYADFVEDFEKWEDEEMNAAETAYYIEVQSRVSKKLLEAEN